MKYKYSFRRAEVNETEEVFALLDKVGSGKYCIKTEAPSIRQAAACNANLENIYVLIEGKQKQVVGAIFIAAENELDAFSCWSCTDGNSKEIEAVVIRSGYQRRQTFYDMLSALVGLLEEQGCQAVRMTVPKAAMQTYRTCINVGFTVVGETVRHGRDSYLMERKIINRMTDTGGIHATPADIKIYTQKGLQLTEKACIAYERDTGRIQAVGNEAWEYMGKATHIIVASPLQEGRIEDFTVAGKMLYFMIQRVKGKPQFLRIKSVAAVVEDGLSMIEQKAFEEVLLQAGIRRITVLSANEYKTEKDYLSLTDRYRMVLVIGVKEPKEAIIEKIQKIITFAKRKGVSSVQLDQLWKQLQEEML